MPPPWLSQNNPWVKNLDPQKHDLKTANEEITTQPETFEGTEQRESGEIVRPMGDFRFNEKAKERMLENLLGLTPKTEKRELLIKEQDKDERPMTEMEKWEHDRQRLQVVSEESTQLAFKRDEGAWTDIDGYQQTREPPAFRDGFNTTLRVKPLPEAHLNNGLTQLPQRATGMAPVADGPQLYSWTQARTTLHQERPIVTHSSRGSQGNHSASVRTQQVHRLPMNPELEVNQPMKPSEIAAITELRIKKVRGPQSKELRVEWPSKPSGSTGILKQKLIHKLKSNGELNPTLKGQEFSGLVGNIKGDLIHRMVQNPDLITVLGKYFMRGISSQLSGLKSKPKSDVSTSRFEHGTSELDGSGAKSNIEGQSGISEKDGTRVQGEVELLLKAISCEEAPAGHHTPLDVEESKRQENELGRFLGNAFVSLGLTLPAGKKDDPLRNDSVALKLGDRMMGPVEAGSSAPLIPESLRKEVAIALGRAVLHLRMASQGVEGGKTASVTDKEVKDRDLRVSIGRLTLQLLESTANRAGKSLTKDPKRREVLANALGSTVLALTSSNSRDLKTDRNKTEAPLLKSLPTVQGPSSSSHSAKIIRQNKPIDLVVKRPLLPGRDMAPTSIPRHIPRLG